MENKSSKEVKGFFRISLRISFWVMIILSVIYITYPRSLLVESVLMFSIIYTIFASIIEITNHNSDDLGIVGLVLSLILSLGLSFVQAVIGLR